jgi:pimeloyl-ACP methyl ester carboxylesterase
MRATTEHALRFIQTMGIQKAHLVGHSRGALPAARLAIDHPELAQTLIIFDTNTLAPGDPPLQPVEPVPDHASLTRDAIRKRLLEWSPDRKPWFTEEYVDLELEIARLPKTQQAAAAFEKARAAWVERNPDKVKARPALARNSGTGWWLYDVKDETLEAIKAGRLKTPTFILWGMNDPGAPLKLGIELLELIAKSVSRVRMHVFNRSGHFPYAEYPAEVAKLLLDFATPQK